MKTPTYENYPPKPNEPPYYNTPMSKIPKDKINEAHKNTEEYLKLLEKWKCTKIYMYG